MTLVAIALPAICAAPEAVLYPGTGTTVDGTVAIEGMHVFGGQLVRTRHGQFGDLFTGGSSLRLLGDSKLRFDGDSAELFAGGVMLNTSSGFPVQCGCVRVKPSNTSARYLIQLQEKTVYVTAQKNEVSVRAKKTVRVDTGKTVAVYCGTAAQNIVFLGSDTASKVIMGVGMAGTPIAPLLKSGNMSSSSPTDR